jgi:heat-inducible transcriptional repressor
MDDVQATTRERDHDTEESPALTERQRAILRLIVREYVATGRPVGSKLLSDASHIGVSPATIRNEMAVLEARGYLEHLHTSGGRIPTNRGYRYFVTHLMGDVELSSSQQLTILHQFRQVELQLEQWVELAASTLAQAAGHVSLVSAPMAQTPRVRHIELVSLQPRLGLVIVVTADGSVRQVMVHWPEDVDQQTLSPIADQLAMSLRGLGPEDVAHHVAGSSTIVRGVLEQVVAALRSFLNVMLPHLDGAPDVRVYIGEENPSDELRRLGIVVSTYGIDREVIGILGVVGPTRMAYDRSVSSVRYMARLMSELVAELHGG